jgi:CBS domain-containing protein
MKISEVMRPGAFTISETDSLGTAQFAMTRAHVRHLPVMTANRIVGMLSERDVLRARAQASDDARNWWALTVHDAMTSPPHTARPDDSLTEVAARMAMAKIGAMPVVERGKLLGIATITDVLDAEVRVAMEPAPAATVTAADVMTPWPITVHPDALLSTAVGTMVQRRIRHLPVVDRESTLVGMLSESDLRAAIGDPIQYHASRYDLPTAELRVRDAMTAPAFAMPFDTPLADLARKLADERLAAILITDKFGALIGIVSYVDALRVLAA